MVTMISDIGFRELNEDVVDYDINKNYSFYIVCDGVGGHNAGEIASKEAAELIKNYLREYYSRSIAPHILESAVQKANKEVFRIAKANDAYSGMGTTVTCALDAGGEIYVAHAGDTVAYILKDGRIAKLTRDHTMVQDMVDSGAITEEEKLTHTSRNIITRSLGTKEELRVDIMEIEKSQVDYMLLCTDGLSDYVSPEEILEGHLKEPDKQKFAEDMVELAKQRGSRDNISLLLFGGTK